RPEWAAELGATLPAGLGRALEESEARGESAVVLMGEARVLAVLGLADRVRESAGTAVRSLREMGVEAVMVTGDSQAAARTVAAALGLARSHARALPGEKARLVAELRAAGPVAAGGGGTPGAAAPLAAALGVRLGAPP